MIVSNLKRTIVTTLAWIILCTLVGMLRFMNGGREELASVVYGFALGVVGSVIHSVAYLVVSRYKHFNMNHSLIVGAFSGVLFSFSMFLLVLILSSIQSIWYPRFILEFGYPILVGLVVGGVAEKVNQYFFKACD